MRTMLAVLLCSSTVALAAPVEMSYSGRVLDNLGEPIDGSTPITVSLYTAASGGSAFWTQDYTPDLQDGFFTVALTTDSAGDPLDSASFSSSVWVGLTVDGGTEATPRNQLYSAPHAAVAEQAVTADVASTGESLVSPNWGRLIVDRSVDNVSMPAEWTTTYLANNIGRTWIWSADGPNFRDPLHCNPLIQVYDQETVWKGQYIATVESSTRINVQWSGWYLRVNNSAGATVDQGNGMVTATLSYEGGLWRVQHMSGVSRVTPFECH